MSRFTCIVLVICSGLSVAQDASPRPNVVLFYVDDLGWKDVACMGSSYYETPHVDGLARAGMLLSSAYSNGPNCAPSRACLMSGQYTPRHGVYTVGNSARGDKRLRKLVPIQNRTDLREDVVTIAEVLKASGYRTATMGKWHLGSDPTTQGFDVNVGGNKTGSPRGGYFSPYRNPQLANGPKGEYLTDRLTTEAEHFIADAAPKGPFFLYLTHYAVHTPIQAKPDQVERFSKKAPSGGHKNPKYGAMVASMDDSLGRVLAALEKAQVADRTVVIFTSDNGGHGQVTNMKPLRGVKGSLHEGGVRVPMIVRWPGRVKAGSRSDHPVIGLDLYPTLVEIAGAQAPESQVRDGESLVGLWTGGSLPAREALFWHFPAYLQGRFEGDAFRTRPAGAIRMGRMKLMEFFEDGRLELYDLVDDISESRNLASERPEVAKELHGRLKAWRAGIGAPVPMTPNPDFDPKAKPRRRKK